MAGWYVRRGEKVIGPVDLATLKESVVNGKLLLSDQLAKDPAGPWTEARRTILFAKKPAEPPSTESPPQSLVPKVEYLPVQDQSDQDQPDISDKIAMVVRATNVFFASIGRGTLAAGSGVARFLSTRAQQRRELKLTEKQRRHELELTRIQAGATADSQRPQAPAMLAPQVSQNTIVKVVQNGGCGCSGCVWAVLLLFIGLGVLGAVLFLGLGLSR